jgi:hypothetical protein
MALINSTSARNAMPPPPVHPFFTNGLSKPAEGPAVRANIGIETPASDGQTVSEPDPKFEEHDEKENLLAASFFTPGTGNSRKVDPHSAIELQPDAHLEEDPNVARRKRRKPEDQERASLAEATANYAELVQVPMAVEPHTVQVLIPLAGNSSSSPDGAGLPTSDMASQRRKCGLN